MLQQHQQSSDSIPTRPTANRSAPSQQLNAEDMNVDDVTQLIKDHRELKEKYNKVKKYYFEKEEQVKQLQNALANQRLSASRTSLDDSEYTNRLGRLDGLIAQLAFSIRRCWKAVPLWLAGSINKDAISTGKQEMTAAGRAFISCWLVDEVFDKYFHPDIEPIFSAHLKNTMKCIRQLAPQSQTAEEEEQVWAKVAAWRLSTIDGLQDMLKAGTAGVYRQQLMEMLKDQLIGALKVHLADPPISDLEGGVGMIIDLAVNLASNFPLESRDVVVEYFMPGTPMSGEVMKVESSIPTLGTSVAEDAADRNSLISTAESESSVGFAEQSMEQRKRTLLGALASKNLPLLGELGASQAEGGGKVRMAVGLAASIRGKSVLLKAPVFST